MPYNKEKDTCDRCGITKEAAKNHPVKTGINHPDYATTTSFYLSWDGGVTCARCHRELEIRKIFKAMDKEDKQ
jgi:hypothetical protein